MRSPRETLDRLVDDMRAQNPDHIAVTGDLTNIAMHEEFENARLLAGGARAARTWSPPFPATTTPTCPARITATAPLWAPWMLNDDAEHVDKALFPFMRRKRHVALIGVSSAVASVPFMATGRVGSDQTRRLWPLLDEARAEGLFRIILIHHPPKLIDPRQRLAQAHRRQALPRRRSSATAPS